MLLLLSTAVNFYSAAGIYAHILSRLETIDMTFDLINTVS